MTMFTYEWWHSAWKRYRRVKMWKIKKKWSKKENGEKVLEITYIFNSFSIQLYTKYCLFSYTFEPFHRIILIFCLFYSKNIVLYIHRTLGVKWNNQHNNFSIIKQITHIKIKRNSTIILTNILQQLTHAKNFIIFNSKQIIIIRLVRIHKQRLLIHWVTIIAILSIVVDQTAILSITSIFNQYFKVIIAVEGRPTQ